MSGEDFNTKREQFWKLWYGIVPGSTTRCKKCTAPDNRTPLHPKMEGEDMFDSINLKETNTLFNCTSTTKETSNLTNEKAKKSCFPNVDQGEIEIFDTNRSKSLKFRQYIREHVRQKRVALTRENCEKYWMGELQKELHDAETF